MTDPKRPLPQITAGSQPYWESVARHAMRLQRCSSCATFRFYPTRVCPACFSTESDWAPVSGRATLHSFSVVYRPVNESFAPEIPYIVALATLEEGPTMMMNLRGVAAGEAAVGMPLRIGYRDVEGFTLPVAFPAGRE